MLHHTKELLQTWKRAPAGERFQRVYWEYAEHDQEWVKQSLLFVALGCFTIGLVFMFDSGPAFVMFALSVALVGTQSDWLARHCDRAHLFVHERLPKRARKPVPVVLENTVVVTPIPRAKARPTNTEVIDASASAMAGIAQRIEHVRDNQLDTMRP